MSEAEAITDPRRSIMPEYRIPEGATDREVRDILGNALLSISAILNLIRADTSVKIGQSDVNATAIQRIELIQTEFDKRLTAIEKKLDAKT